MNKIVNKSNITKISIIIVVLFTIITTGTYAFQQLSVDNSNATGTGGCFNVNYTGQNLTAANIATTTNFSEGAQATVKLNKNTSCKIYTEANIYLKTNSSTTAPIESVQALKYKVYNGSSQISEGTITKINEDDNKGKLLATVPLTDTETTYTVYLYIDANISTGQYTSKTYSGYVYATSAQTSTIEGNYLVTFDTNNGENLSLSKKVSKGQEYGWLPTPKKEGYNFSGWKLSSTNITSTTTVNQSADHTLTAQWTAKTPTVTLNPNGGSVSSSSKQVTYGSTYGTLPTPTKSGKTFKGWTIAPVGYDEVEYVQSTGTQYITTNIIPTNSMGAYAKVVSTNITSDLLYFGSKGTDNSRFWVGNTSSKVYFGWNTVSYAGSTTTTSATNIIKMNYLNNRQSIYNTSVVTSNLGSLAANSYPIAIFAGNNAGTISNKSSIKLYELKISNGPTIINNFIPCYQENSGKYGLCDMVNIKFYPNSATSGNDFSHGSNVYVTSSTTVNNGEDHTLSAVWQ